MPGCGVRRPTPETLKDWTRKGGAERDGESSGGAGGTGDSHIPQPNAPTIMPAKVDEERAPIRLFETAY